ncbi:hypothetical protein DFS34DRAFT_43629 [Phlyctochytrium arcticum]|nr:hypothetical protein DFS34DRAFT_43629 [Phlyctochytrium arcticum]
MMGPPDVIRFLDSSGTTVLDSLLADYEDSFTLDTFGDLAEAHELAEPEGTKSFIIARVQTWDAKQPGKAFYSYYSAYQLNRILFQTQVYLGKKLIHRLHVLNPLTNTDIIGDVQYFMVRPAGAEQVQSGDKSGEAKKEILATSVEEDEKGSEGMEGSAHNLLARKKSMTRRNKTTTESGSSRGRAAVPSIVTNLERSPVRRQVNIPPPSPSVREIEAGNTGSWTMAAPSVTEITEEESTGPGPQPRKFSIKTWSLRSPYSEKVSPKQIRSAFPALEGIKRDGGEFIVDIPPSPTKLSIRSPFGTEVKLKSPGLAAEESSPNAKDLRVVTKPPSGLMQMRNPGRNNRLHVPMGVVTRFAEPVSVHELRHVSPPTPTNRRRSFSYINSAAQKDTSPTFEDWLKTTLAEKRRLKTSPVSESEGSEQAEPTTEKSDVPMVYDAVLFATDTDYLESSKTRAAFRLNAVTPEDVKLFEMPEYAGPDAMPNVVIVDDSPICEWCYPSPGALEQYGPRMRWFHKSKCWLLLFTMIAGGCSLIIFVLSKNPNTTDRRM